jgi:hypothetical protein
MRRDGYLEELVVAACKVIVSGGKMLSSKCWFSERQTGFFFIVVN